jgi:acetyl/propionyl-CoA carboxylase alpha subunit
VEGAPVILKRVGGSRTHDVELISRDGTSIRARIDGTEIVGEFAASANGGGTLTIEGRRYRVRGTRRKDSVLVAIGPASFEFKQVEDAARRRAHGLAAPEITAPMPGKVLRVLVKDGDSVAAAQPLVVLEAMKMETTLSAESPATVKRVLVVEGAMVDHGAVLIELSPPADSSTSESQPPGR